MGYIFCVEFASDIPDCSCCDVNHGSTASTASTILHFALGWEEVGFLCSHRNVWGDTISTLDLDTWWFYTEYCTGTVDHH